MPRNYSASPKNIDLERDFIPLMLANPVGYDKFNPPLKPTLR
jgi:hypothetical protein